MRNVEKGRPARKRRSPLSLGPDSRMTYSVPLLALFLAACGVSPNWTEFTPRPAAGLPERFEAPNAGPGVPTACTSPLLDARDGTELVMLRSSNQGGSPIGDYAVSPAGRYGIGENEALRVDCRSWRPLGMVPR